MNNPSLGLKGIFFVLCCVLATSGQAEEDLNQLREQVFTYVQQLVSDETTPNQRLEINVSHLDSRLKLRNCQLPPQLIRQGNDNQLQGKLLIKASCHNPSAWSVYIPVFVKRYIPIVASKAPLSRGHVIQAEDLVLVEKDISKLRQQYFTAPEHAIGQAAKRNLPAGVLKPRMLEAARLVNRGDEVYISARQGSVSVQMPAIALSDGKLGQQISVKNSRSNKTVRARVIGPGQVEITM